MKELCNETPQSKIAKKEDISRQLAVGFQHVQPQTINKNNL